MTAPVIPAALILAAVAAASERPPTPPRETDRPDPYPAGEILEYRVKVKKIISISGGTATMTVGALSPAETTESSVLRSSKGAPGLRSRGRFGGVGKGGAREKVDGRPAARLGLRMSSSGFARKLYPLDIRATSLVDVATGGTLRFSLDKNERGESEREEFSAEPAGDPASATKNTGDAKGVEGENRSANPASPAAGAAIVKSYRRRDDGREERRETKVDRPVQDVLSLFYELRRLPLKLGRLERVAVFNRHKLYPGSLGPDGLERVKVKGIGVFWAIVVHPSTGMPGLFSEKGDATIWVEETTHVMLRMVVRSPKGSVTMILTRAENSPLLDAPGCFASGSAGARPDVPGAFRRATRAARGPEGRDRERSGRGALHVSYPTALPPRRLFQDRALQRCALPSKNSG